MQAETMHVRVAREGLRVIDPLTRRPLPDEGARVPRNGYWTKRLQQGDVEEIETPETLEE